MQDRQSEPPRGTLSRRTFLARTGQFATLAALSGGGAEFLIACGNGSQAPKASTSAKPVKGGHVIENGNPAGLNPVLNANTTDKLVHTNLFDGLITNDATGNLLPRIAQSLPKISADAKTYTFTLRKDVKWTDGQQLTADDVLFTYNLMFDPAYKDVKSAYRGDLEHYVDSIAAPDPYTVVFKLKEAYVPFLALHGYHGILPKHVLGSLTSAQFNTADFNAKPTVSNGAFKFVEWLKDDHVTMARNDTYYRGAAWLDQYVFKNTPTTSAFISQLKTGEMDCGRIIAPTDVPGLQASPNVTVFSYPANGLTNFFFQMDPAKPSGKIFQSKAVRQALMYALDRQGMVDGIYSKIGGEVPSSIMPPVSWAYNANVKTKYTFDMSKAAAMLDADGWVKASGGTRAKDGVPLKFEITAPVNSTQYTNCAQSMQDSWKQLGCDVSVRLIQYAQLLNIAYFTRAFDIVIPGYAFNVDPDPSNYFHSRNISAGGQNAGSYRNPQLDSLLDQAVTTADQSKRKQLYFQIQDLIADEVPMGLLVLSTGFFAFNKRIHGMGADTIGTFTNLAPRPGVKDVFVTS